MENVLEQIKKAEALGIVGDSLQIRLELVEKINNGIITHEQSLEVLKEIKRQAHKEGLLIRSDFTKNKLWDYEFIQKKIIYLRHKKIEKNLFAKPDLKTTIIKI